MCGGAYRRAERAGQGVGRELRGVQLARAEASQLGGDLRRADPGGVEDRPPAREAHRRASGRGGGAAAAGAESRVGHAIALDAHRQLDLIAAGESARDGDERAGGAATVTLR